MDRIEPELIWQLFCLTGEPLAYMLYRSVGGEEDDHLS